jgi:hypothetical protein
VAYTLAGQYQCGGTVQFESPAFLCRFSGSLAPIKVTKSKKASTTPLSIKGLHLTLVGFNSATGATTWTEPVSDVAALADGQVQFIDATHLVVDQANGHPVVLDTSTGRTTPLAKGATYWCTTLSFFKVDEDNKVNPTENRVEANPYRGCTADGKPTTKLPHTTPSTIGATVDGVFFWQSPKGLGSEVVGRQAGLA